MSTEENQSSWMDGCLSMTEPVGQAAGFVAGAGAFSSEVGAWATSAVETHNPLVLGMAPEVGAHAGKDAAQAYQQTVPVAEHNWASACEVLNPIFGGHEAASGSHAPDAFAHPPHDAAQASHPNHHHDAISHPTAHPSAASHPGGHSSIVSHGHAGSASSNTH